MPALKFLVVLSSVFNGALYVAKPPNSTSAHITYGRNNTWKMMDLDSVNGIPVFKLSIRNKTVDEGFKIKFTYPTYSIETSWQSPKGKVKMSSDDRTCCISATILSVTLFIVLLMLIVLTYLSVRFH